MSDTIDKRGKLDEDTFDYRVAKDGKVFITWHGKTVTTLSAKKAGRFISDMANAQGSQARLLMTKATGHFKHGNEKANKR